MKFTFRVTLLTILLSLLVLTVGALGYSFYSYAHFTSADLSARILSETSVRVDHQLNDVLFDANQHGDLNRRLLESKDFSWPDFRKSGRFSREDFRKLVPYWLEVMRVYPKLTRMSLGLEETGAWFYIRRTPEQRLALGELLRNPKTKKLELTDYWADDFPAKPFYFNPDAEDEDPRQRPWYIAARQAKRQVWSDTYVFFGVRGVADSPGVSNATPILRADGSVVGVLTTSFDLVALCDFLKTLQVGKNGYAFVVEHRPDAGRWVIAHRKPEELLRTSMKQGQPVTELVPPAELSDPLVTRLLQEIPAGLNPSDQVGLKTVRFTVDGTSYLGSYSCLSTKATPDWFICIVLPEADVLEETDKAIRRTIFLGIAVFVLAALLAMYLSAQIAWPLERLVKEAEAVGRLDTAARPVAHSFVQEVDHLAVAMEEMKVGLRSFLKYAPSDLIRALLASKQEAQLGGERRIVTIFFSDIANFTTIAEGMTPEALVHNLSEYMNELSTQILTSGGTVDKYIGDSIMAFWGAPAANAGHALAACTAAVHCQARLKELIQKWQAQGRPAFFTRIGVNTGEVVVGNIGSETRMSYTVIGDPVNLASRIEGLNKHWGTQVLISESTYLEAKAGVVARPLGWVAVKGKKEAILLYELLGLKGEVDQTTEELAQRHAEALRLYRSRDWRAAIRAFQQVLALRPGDLAAGQMVVYCQQYLEQPPGEDWTGIHTMQDK